MIFDKLSSLLTRNKDNSNLSLTDIQSGMFVSATGGVRTADLNNGWVSLCVDAIASACSSAPIVYKRVTTDDDTDEVVTNAAPVAILNSPNIFQTTNEFLYFIVSQTELYGTAFIRKVDNSYIPLPTDRVKLKQDRRTQELSFEYTRSLGSTEKIPMSELMIFKYPSSKSVVLGESPATRVKKWIDISNAGEDFNNLFFKQGTHIGDILETKLDKSDASKLDMLREAFRKRHAGGANAHAPLILPDGVTYKKAAQSMKDMDFATLEKSSRDKILAAWRVPKAYLGISESTISRAEAEVKDYEFAKHTVQPKLRMLGAFLTKHFAEDGYYFEFENVVPRDREFTLKRAQIGAANTAFMTMNEVRESQGLPPLTNGDRLPIPFADNNFGEPVRNKRKKKKYKASEAASRIIEARIMESLSK